MKRNTSVLLLVFGLLSVGCPAETATLKTLHAVHSLTNAEAAKGFPVAFESTVTYYSKNDVDLFVQDGKEALYVATKANQDLLPGDRVLVQGKTHDSFRPEVMGDTITLLHHGALPKPVPASFPQMVRADLDCLFATVHATARSAENVTFGNLPGIDLKLQMDGGDIDATVIGNTATLPAQLLDSEIEITGVVSGKFDSKMQMTGIVLEVSSVNDLKILKTAPTSTASLPITPMDEVLSAYFVKDLTRRVHVQGTITYYQQGSAVVLQNGSKSMWITTQTEIPLHIGGFADATGFPSSNGDLLTLTQGEIQESRVVAPIAPQKVTTAELVSGLHAFDLVSAEGLVLMAAREAAQDEYVLQSDGTVFSAIYRHPEVAGGSSLPLMKPIPVGSKVQVSGICMLQYGTDPFHGPIAVDLLLRSFDDIAVVSKPSILSVRNLMLVVAILLAVVVAVGARGRSLDRKVRLQTAAMGKRIEAEAALERRRSRILEDINGLRPLAEIIEDIVEMVSFSLDGAPCWCQINDGARLGNYSPVVSGQHQIRAEIPARSGPPLGAIFVSTGPFGPGSASPAASPVASTSEGEILSLGTKLAALAIETRRLYSDLVHRSEFDMLTDIHNRFSLEKRLDSLIIEARNTAGIFGLIFIDLDYFKQVNDVYGHRIGDLYLQEVAVRMKHQLRTGDLLARLGGDEFAALAPSVHTRNDVEDVARRLVRSFDDPFEVEGCILRGTASIGIALYPEDGTSKDSLLSVADAAMYTNKHTRREVESISADKPV